LFLYVLETNLKCLKYLQVTFNRAVILQVISVCNILYAVKFSKRLLILIPNHEGQLLMHLTVFTENLDRHLYRKILNNHLYDNADNVLGHRWVFQQDNDPKHTSHDVQSDLKIRLPRRVLSWPSYSPDLNPIENVWAVLKKNVEKRIKKMVAQKKKIAQNIFIDIITDEWDSLEKDVIVNSISSMKNRIQACIEAEGGHTKY